MGYTHYWTRARALDKATFAAAVADCAKVVELATAQGIALAGWDGEGTPDIERAIVAFNGRGAEAHESFAVPCISDGRERDDGRVFEFCKTAHKPYDAAVVACLVVFKHHLGDDFWVSSDAMNTDELQDGIDLAEAAGIPAGWVLGEDASGDEVLRREEVAA